LFDCIIKKRYTNTFLLRYKIRITSYQNIEDHDHIVIIVFFCSSDESKQIDNCNTLNRHITLMGRYYIGTEENGLLVNKQNETLLT